MVKQFRVARSFAGRVGAIAGGAVIALSLWIGLGGSMGAAPLVPDPITCLPTCEVDGRSLVSAGDDPTTLAAQEISVGLSFTAAAGGTGNFELYDGDNVATNWDVLFNCPSCPDNNAAAPELIIELFADPAGTGGIGSPLATWTPGAPVLGTEMGTFPTTNNDWNGVTFNHDDSAINGTNYLYALHIRPANPSVDKGWNAFKVRAAGTTVLLGNQVVGFIGAMNNPGDLDTIYPNGIGNPGSPYDGTWSFKTRLPAFLGDVTVFDGDMDYGNSQCTYNDTDDPDSIGIPPFALGSAAVDEGVAVANAPSACLAPGSGTRTGTPAEDNSGAAFRRVPTIIPAGIAYQLKAPGSPQNPNGQIFLNQNPSGNKEWEQFKIQLVQPGDVTNGACPDGGYPADVVKGYAASDCRTTDLPGGVWEVQLDGMDLSNLNFWFFSFKVEPIETTYSIGRLVWYDANSNGVQDLCAGVPCAPELGIAGVAYTVYDGPLPGSNVVRTGVTDANGEFLETALAAANYTVVVDATNFDPGQPLEGLTSTTGGETQNGIEVGLPICIDTNNPIGCGQPAYDEALFGYVRPPDIKYGVNAPTQATCQDYISGDIEQENSLWYMLAGANNIGNVTPGVIFFFTTVTVGQGDTLTVVQSRTGTGAGPLLILGNQARVLTTNCALVTGWQATQDVTTGTVSFPPIPPGTYVVQVKWNPKSLGGKPKPVPNTIFYTFAAALNGVGVPSSENAPALALEKKFP
jgi:hypothetical protein